MAEANPDSVEDPWINKYWRPAIGIMYIVICCFDFIVFPVLSALYQAMWKLPYSHWDPLTLKSGAIFHLSIGAILTATSYGRSQEKIAAIKTGFGESGSTTTTTSYGQQPMTATYERPYDRPPVKSVLKREPGGP